MAQLVGAYHFPGWVIGEPNITWRPNPWAAADTTNNIYMGDPEFAGRMPLPGYYNEAQKWVADWAINEAADAGIDFFAVDVYWDSVKPFHHRPFEQMLASKYAHRMKFALLYANPPGAGVATLAAWRACVDYWIEKYLRHPQMLKIGGKPVVMIFDTDGGFRQPSWVYKQYPTKSFWGDWKTGLTYYVGNIVRDMTNNLGSGVAAYWECLTTHTAGATMSAHSANWQFRNASPARVDFGTSMTEALNDARSRAVAAGLPGIHFVGIQQAHPYWLGPSRMLELAGFDAISSYAIRYTYTGVNWSTEAATQTARAESYNELCTMAESQWDLALTQSNSNIPYYPLCMAGWDRRPWIAPASRYPTVDTNTARADALCAGSPERFAQHLAQAKLRLQQYPTKTGEIAMIYAWNEFGEGGYLAPTVGRGRAMGDAVRTTFGKTPVPRATRATAAARSARGG